MMRARLIVVCLIVSSALCACKKKQETTFYESNRKESVEAPVKEVPKDILATVYHLLGIDPHTEIPDRLGRRFPIAGSGIVRPELLA